MFEIGLKGREGGGVLPKELELNRIGLKGREGVERSSILWRRIRRISPQVRPKEMELNRIGLRGIEGGWNNTQGTGAERSRVKR